MLQPEERIGPSPGKSLGAIASGGALVLLVIAGTMALFDDRNWMPSPSEATTAQKPASALAPPTARPSEPPSPAASTNTGLAPPVPPQHAPAIASPPAPATTPEPLDTAEEPEGAPERLPPPPVDRADPLQVRAAAVGLHPELSRVLLGKLTATDFKNAEHAIKTALAETPDNQDHTHPRQAGADLAVFHVRFVPGAPADCRRYIVTVTKERWAHTALPMESCGVTRPAPRRG